LLINVFSVFLLRPSDPSIATVLPRIGSNETDLIRAAHEVLYQAKNDGRDRMKIFDETNQGTVYTFKTSLDLFDTVN